MTELSATVADVVAAVHRRYDPAGAEAWDAVGLGVRRPGRARAPDPPRGRPDPEDVVDEALAAGAGPAPHASPLLLRPVSSVAATGPAGRVVHRLIGGGCALLAAHTNADVARDGVSDVLAETVGLGRPRAAAVPAGRRRHRARTDRQRGPRGALVVVRRARARGAARPPRTGSGSRATCTGPCVAWRCAAARVRRPGRRCRGRRRRVPDRRPQAPRRARPPRRRWSGAARRRALGLGMALARRVAALLVSDLAADGVTVEARVSEIVTDPWTARL